MSNRTKLTPNEINKIKSEFPFIPNDYLNYLSIYGYGESISGKSIYGGPSNPNDIFPNYKGPKALLLGDDSQGYCFVYNIDKKEYGEISPFGEYEYFKDEKMKFDFNNYAL